jgi:hypothetical protein
MREGDYKMSLLSLLNDIKKVIYDDPNTPHQPGPDPGGLIGGIENLFGQYGDQNGDRSVRSASQDPMGDPGSGGQFSNVRPASQDPLGDPGLGGRNVRPASEDPLGDPG